MSNVQELFGELLKKIRASDMGQLIDACADKADAFDKGVVLAAGIAISDREELIDQQAAEIEALKGKWISVADELPLVDESVLVCNGGEVIMANLNSDSLFECGAFRPTKVTHWQPLPAPPEGV